MAVADKNIEKSANIKTWKYCGLMNNQNEAHINVPTEISTTKKTYVCNVLREGLMGWTREDAAKENDGDRLI